MLVLAAKTGRIGCVLLVDGVLKDWKISENGSKSGNAAVQVFRTWLADYQPDLVVSENPDTASRKGEKQRAILKVFADVAEELPLLNMVVARKRRFKNLYLEAAALAERHEAIAALVPSQPPIWLPQPRQMVYFEALALAESVMESEAH